MLQTNEDVTENKKSEVARMLAQYCDPDSYDRHTMAPFSYGAWSYGTNGHLLVRVPRAEDIEEFAEARVEAVITPLEEAKDFKPFPALAEITPERCPECCGRGHKHACPDCECTCSWCAGDGEVFPTVGLAPAIFDGKYIAKLQALPAIAIVRSTDPSAPMPFHFDGGEGLLMPRNARTGKREHHIDAA